MLLNHQHRVHVTDSQVCCIPTNVNDMAKHGEAEEILIEDEASSVIIITSVII